MNNLSSPHGAIAQWDKKGSEKSFLFLSNPLKNHSKSFNLSLMADLTNSVIELKPCLPMAFFLISSVNDVGILRDIYSFSAMKLPYNVIDLCILCVYRERYKAIYINNVDSIPLITLNSSSFKSVIWRDGERDEREQNT